SRPAQTQLVSQSHVNNLKELHSHFLPTLFHLHGFERLIAFALVGFVAGNTFYFSASVGNES
ncbi:MAG: hypothetical protein ACW7DQ_18845, partial [Paraglaciecola chathamensis]